MKKILILLITFIVTLTACNSERKVDYSNIDYKEKLLSIANKTTEKFP